MSDQLSFESGPPSPGPARRDVAVRDKLPARRANIRRLAQISGLRANAAWYDRAGLHSAAEKTHRIADRLEAKP